MPRLRLAILLPILALVAACGGGGGAPVAPAPIVPQVLDLGTVSSASPTFFDLTVDNPFNETGTVSLVSLEGPLVVAPGALPQGIPARGSLALRLALVPSGEGALEGSIALVVEASGARDNRITQVLAMAQGAQLTLTGGPLDFGDVLPGTTADRAVTLRNLSTLTPVTVSNVTSTHAAFHCPSALPLTLLPGASTSLPLRYTASAPGTPSGVVTVVTDAVNGPHVVAVQGATGGREITDFGSVAFDGSGNTAALTVQVPADAISLMLEGQVAGSSVVGLRLLTGPGGKVYENEALTGAYIWMPANPVFTAQVPNTDRTDVQLVPGGGTYTFKLLRWSGGASTVSVRAIVQRRPTPASANLATLDLNVFLANAIAPTAATAATDTTLQSVLGSMGTILQQQGIVLGDIDYYDVTDPTYDDVTEAEFGPLLRLSSAASEHRLNLFFVRTALGGGVLGVAATLGGPSVNGTDLSGVMSLYSTNNPSFIGLVAAHEVGHFVGLAHTVESAQNGGAHDDITDTLECPSTGTNSVCTVAGGGYLMHWQAVGGTTITDGQGLVIRGHPHMGPRRAPATTLQGKPFAVAPTIEVGDEVSPDWCGTCRRLQGPKGR
jgi:hypothetical protein